MEITAATWGVLGLIEQKPRTGYDIKRAVERTIRHFWAASPGQIYPELRRLEQAGWIEGSDEPNGGRQRRVYRITDDGTAALQGWLASRDGPRVELRDESLLRLFFADAVTLDHGLGFLAGRREGFRQMLEYLESLDDGSGIPDPPFIDLVYRWGLDFCRWNVEWCDSQAERMRTEHERAA
jgi:DNA-binding PadR family transcriptional regulator